MSILIGADCVPTKSNERLFETGDIETLFGKELVSLFHNAEFSIVNLELPLCSGCSPIDKCGPNLKAGVASAAGYKALGISAFTLANNHIMDQGECGLYETIAVLNRNSIRYVGAGQNLAEAQNPLIIVYKDKKIGFYACAEHEFSIAGSDKAGANPFDPLYSLDHIAALKQQCDFVVVLYHGGKEHYRYPSPRLQQVCRRMVDKGADAVFCQHSHCIGCREQYRTGEILYGQGNLLFDLGKEECWNTGLLAELDIKDNELSCSYHAVCRNGSAVKLASRAESDRIQKKMDERSEEIKDAAVLQQRYDAFADTLLSEYLTAFSGKRSIVKRILNKLSGYRLNELSAKRRYNKRALIVIRNYTECEAHREVMLHAVSREAERKQ